MATYDIHISYKVKSPNFIMMSEVVRPSDSLAKGYTL